MFQSHPLTKNSALLAPTLQALRAAAHAAFPICASILDSYTTEPERLTLSFVHSQPLSDGSWYRPFHNLFVPMAMIRICESSGADRDLVLAAILHDVGYSALEIPGTLQGAAWDKKHARLEHMAASRVMSERHLRQLINDGNLSMSEERLQKILEIIATHDDPYIGKPLSDSEALLHRDADRLFVISCTSFWKDYLALLSDPTQLKRFDGAGVEATPEALLAQRQLSFVRDPSHSLSTFTLFEPMTSDFAQRLVQLQYASRTAEIPSILSLILPHQVRLPELETFLTGAIVADFKVLTQ